MTRFRKILVPVDFSDHSSAAIDTATEIAKMFGAKIDLLHCYRLDPADVSPYGVAASASYDSRVRDRAARRLKESEEKLAVEGIETETSLSSAFPSEAITKMAQEVGADLIVMGTHGRGAIAHVLLGSTTEKVVRKSPCAVMTVRMSEHKFVMP